MSVEGIKILVLDRGWVLVGRVSRHPELAFHWRVTDCRCIRLWGSERGLAQIAREGPTGQTKLDDPCDLSVPYRAVLQILDVEESKWESHLKSGASGGRQSGTTRAR